MARSELETKHERLGHTLSANPASSQDKKLPLHMYAPSMVRHDIDMKPQPHLPNVRHTGTNSGCCSTSLNVVIKQRHRDDGGESGATTAAGSSVINVWQNVLCSSCSMSCLFGSMHGGREHVGLDEFACFETGF